MLDMRRSCEIEPLANFSWKRELPSARTVAAILRATVSGEPMYIAPSGPTSCWKRIRLYSGQPRSRPMVLLSSATPSKASSQACWSVSATWPGECTEIGICGFPSSSSERR
ncbi:hypothetical protein SRABI128_03368 [Microbacterium sp. Bi128]|nr:hypothetical protein SRABI128_03368 [Microbacterium sp. Bi128]